jgi:ABC-type nickel/cobalt efflux system permease component RcnA
LIARLRPRTLRWLRLGPTLFLLAALVLQRPAWPHDIPNQRVDRSIQATIRPGKLQIDYEVSLTELTLTQDLRALIGSLPGGDRSTWLARYGEVTGPLDAKGFLVHCDGHPVVLGVRGFDLVVEEHPRYTFHFEAPLPLGGRLWIHDTNYISSEGTSRLAVRGSDGAIIEGNDLPEDVSQIPIRPLWQLGDEEERRTRRVDVIFRGPKQSTGQEAASPALLPHDAGIAEGNLPPPKIDLAGGGTDQTGSLSRLLDRGLSVSWLGLLLISAGLGAVHSVQPGHGKTLVSAIALAPGARWYQPALLGVFTTAAHTSTVLLFAAILWFTGASQVASLHQGLTRVAGFAIAAGGCWRMGRSLGRWVEHPDGDRIDPGALSLSGLAALGIAGGLVPCWDAVALLILSAALGRLAAGVLLVLAFGAGMSVVLVGVGLAAARLKRAVVPSSQARAWETQLGLASGVALAAIGLVFFLG